MEALTELITIINTTPFRTIALIVGFLALSVGYGLRIKAVIDVDNINKTYAKTVGVIFLILGVVLFVPDIARQPGEEDPFLLYYIVSVMIVAVFSGAILKLTRGQQQLVTMKGFYLVLAVIITFVVLWRAIGVYFFVTGPGDAVPPLGFQKPAANYLPYLVLLSIGVGIIAWLIYANTRQAPNSENRIRIFQYFAILCVYLGLCRVAWEVVDLLGKKMMLSQ